MRYSILILVLVLQTVTASAQSLYYLFTGSGIPEDQGWSLSSGAGHLGGSVTVTPQTGGGVADFLSVETTGMQYHFYSYTTGYREFLATARIKVQSANYNSFDAGLYFSGTGTLVSLDRSNGFFLTPSSVGFLDGVGSPASITPNQFHDFSILLRDGQIRLFVDDSPDDILSGAATAELARTLTGASNGIIMFGDQTNDDGINSQYQIDDVRFYGITVPEPSSAILSLCGVILLLHRRRFLPDERSA